MTPDDPRHGTPAGAQKHWRDGEPVCDPCARARARASKAARLDTERGRPRMVELGEQAVGILASVPRDQLSRATGMTVAKLGNLETAGASARVHRSTRDRILAAGGQSFWTPIGIQRRVRALHALGWSMAALADECGVHARPMSLLAHRQRMHFVRREFAETILSVYKRHSMTLRTGCGATRSRRNAERFGWVPPLAWDDDIDDPDARPSTGDRADDIDEAVVLRLLAHDTTVASTRAEKIEAMRRWLSTGRSQSEFCDIHGWHEGRYTVREDPAA